MENKADVIFSRRLFDCRRSLGLSQSDFAKMLGVTQGHYSKIEAGRIGISFKNQKAIDGVFGDRLRKGSSTGTELEEAVLSAMRASPEFRALVEAGLKCIKKNNI